MADHLQNPLLGKIAAYTEILNTDPRSTIFVSLSESYRKMGMLDEALSVAQEGLAHLPDYGPGYVVLARIKCQQGDMAASEASFTKALDIDPDSLAALVGFSRLCLLLNNKDKARSLLLTARVLSPADSVINKLLLSLPEPEDEPAVEVSSSFFEDVPTKVTLASNVKSLETATLAELYLKQGMADKALEIYRTLLLRDPDNLEFRRRIRAIEVSSNGSLENIVADSDSIPTNVIVEEDEQVVSVSPGTLTVEITGLSISPVEETSVLDQLNCMLTSIRKRRGDV